jgi:hypothetical protein
MLAVCVFLAFKAPAEDVSPWPEYAQNSIVRVTARPTLKVGKNLVSFHADGLHLWWKRNSEATLDPETWPGNHPELRFYGDEIDLDTEAAYTFEYVNVGTCDNFVVEQEYVPECYAFGCTYLLRILQGDQVLFGPETKFSPRVREPLPEACGAAPNTPLVEEMKRLLYLRTLCEVQDHWEFLADYDQPIDEAKTFCDDASALPKAIEELTSGEESKKTILLVMQPFWSFFVLVLLFEPEAGDIDTLSVDMYTGICLSDFDLTPHPIEVARVSPDLPLFVGRFDVEGHGTAVTAIYTRNTSGATASVRYRANNISLAFH